MAIAAAVALAATTTLGRPSPGAAQYTISEAERTGDLVFEVLSDAPALWVHTTYDL